MIRKMGRDTERMPTLKRFSRRDALWLAALFVVAASLRLPALDAIPPGFQFDETYNAWDALAVVEGARPIFLPANAGREPLYTYWQAPFVALWGPTPIGVRLASAIPGIATVLLLYLFVRLLFPTVGTRLAGLAALCLALSYWHLHFSRYGIRSILVPFWQILGYSALWLGIERDKLGWFALCGAALAAGAWTHPAGRLVPFVAIVVMLYIACADRPHRWRHLLGLAVIGVVALALFSPIGYYFWNHPHSFLDHASDVSIFQERVSRGKIGLTLLDNLLRVLAMFALRGDMEWIHNLPGRPVFDPLLSIAFAAGVFAGLSRLLSRRQTRLARARHLLLFTWLVTTLLPSVLSDMVPNFSRTLGAAPVVMLVCAGGLEWIWRRLGIWRQPKLAVLGLAVLMSVSGGFTVRDYTLRFGANPETPYHYDRDKILAAEFIREEAEYSTIYMARLWANQATIRLLTRDVDLRSVETDAALVLPRRDGDRDILYAVPPEQEAQIVRLAQAWRPWGQRDTIFDDRGAVLLHLFRIPSGYRPAPNAGAELVSRPDFPLGSLDGGVSQFGSGMRLLGHQIAPDLDAQRELEVTLVWEALASMDENYTVSAQLRDVYGDSWGQVDHWPGNRSYPTKKWQPGDVIVDRYRIRVDGCAPPGPYHLFLSCYQLYTGEPLRTPGGASQLLLGDVDLGPVRGATAQELSPSTSLDQVFPHGAQLFGYDLSTSVLEIGRPFTIRLYWQGTEDLSDSTGFVLRLKSDDGVGRLGHFDVGSRAKDVPLLPSEARCQTLRLSATAITPGAYALQVLPEAADGNAVTLAAVRIDPSSRRFVAPQLPYVVDQDFGDAIRLLGYDLSAEPSKAGYTVTAGRALDLDLYWETLRPVNKSYTVFTHLLGEADQLVAQRDSVPRDGTYPTTDWVRDEVVQDGYRLDLPRDLPPGEYHLSVGLYDAATGLRLPLTDHGKTTGTDHLLLTTTLTVEASR